MDNETVTVSSVAWTYGLNTNTLERNYKEALSDYNSWDQKAHAEDYVLNVANIGPRQGIDETSINGDVWTIVHNKDAHGRKGAIVAMVKGTKAEDVAKVLCKIPLADREKVTSLTMDLSDSMRAIASLCFPKARVTRDCFHVMKRGGEAIDELRMRFKRDAVKKAKKEKAEYNKRQERLREQRKKYAERMRKKHGKKWHKSKRGRKPEKVKGFKPERLTNKETLVEALTKCRIQLQKSREKWTKYQEERAKILFKKYPKLEEAYLAINKLRYIFKNTNLDKAAAKERLEEWYKDVNACTLREVKSVRDTIKYYEDEILNYFIERETNASAESLNSKIKIFRADLRGVNDVSFFMFRVFTVLG